jgi:ribonuclease P protein component
MPSSAVSPIPVATGPLPIAGGTTPIALGTTPITGSAVPVAGSTVPRAPGRLTRRAEFLHVAAKGRKAPMPGLVLQALKRQDDAPARLGFTVTKRVGNAVIRNRTRRRLKEAARLLLRDQPVTGADLVLIGRDATRSRDFAVLQDDLRRALTKAGVL